MANLLPQCCGYVRDADPADSRISDALGKKISISIDVVGDMYRDPRRYRHYLLSVSMDRRHFSKVESQSLPAPRLLLMMS